MYLYMNAQTSHFLLQKNVRGGLHLPATAAMFKYGVLATKQVVFVLAAGMLAIFMREHWGEINRFSTTCVAHADGIQVSLLPKSVTTMQEVDMQAMCFLLDTFTSGEAQMLFCK